ncbi:MAG TPA: hypothetical protein VGV35_09805 [Bryobacteraceae bacterium]|nr:hypothetical protein [Bryobacteraceae bacterium]
MAKSLGRAAIGLRAHSGWAALVAVAGSFESPQVIARRRIETSDAAIRGSKQPFHAAEPMELPDAKAFIKRCTDSTRRLSRDALQAAVDGLRDKRYEAVCCGIVLGAGRSLPDLAKILASHALIHTAEGEFYRTALVEAAGDCGLAVFGVKEKELFARAAAKFGISPEKLERRLTEVGKPLGPPWTQDQKYAALAGWMALA